jgi:hypothetical protein
MDVTDDSDLSKLHDFPSVKRDPYLSDSRADIIDQVCSLIESSDAFQFIWLQGGAGVGKSTLVHHLKSLFQDSGCLAAYIAFNRQSTGNTSLKDVVHAVARQIAFNYPSSRAAISDALRHLIPGSEHVMLLQHLVLLPLASVDSNSVKVILFDGWDEYIRFDEVLQAFGTLKNVSQLPDHIYVVMTSRPEPDIQEMIVSLEAKILPIHDVPNDIMIRFFEGRLQKMDPWLQKGDPMQRIPLLATAAGGLFAWAATACAFIGNRKAKFTPSDRLTSVLESSHLKSVTTLIILYDAALVRLFPPPSEDSDDVLSQSFSFLFAMLLLVEVPMTVDDLCALVEHEYPIDTFIGLLQSLQTRPSAYGQEIVTPLSDLFHTSFLDHLHGGCDQRFRVTPQTFDDAHRYLAVKCIQAMTKWNRDTFVLSDIPGYVVYAANNWPKHAAHADPGSWSKELDEDVRESLRVFYRTSGAIAAWGKILAQVFGIPLFAASFINLKMYYVKYQDEEDEDKRDDVNLSFVLETLAGDANNDLEVKPNVNPAFLRDTLFVHLVTCRLQYSQAATASADRLIPLMGAFTELYKLSGTTSYLEYLIRLNEEALSLPSSDRRVSDLSFYLPNALELRFRRSGNKSDIEHAISLRRESATLPRDLHSQLEADLVTGLGYDLFLYFEKTGEVLYLDGAISILEGTINLPIPQRATRLNNLAFDLLERFRRMGERVDLGRAVQYSTEAMHLDPKSSQNLHTVAMVLFTCYLQDGRMEDLDRAIGTLTEVVQCTRPTHIDFKMFSDDLEKMQASKDQLLKGEDRLLEISLNPSSDPQGTEQLSQPLLSLTLSQWQSRQGTESSTSVLSGSEVFEEQVTESTRSLDGLMEALRAKPSDELSPSEDLLEVIKTWKENGYKEPAGREDTLGSDS